MATPCQRRAHAYPCYLLILLPMLACCLLHSGVVAQSRPSVGETELLLQIKHAWGNPPALAAWNWAAGTHCRWPYVWCDPAGHVTGLALANINLTGPVPDAVGGLSSLLHLDLSNNFIGGVFPTVLYRCISLRYLNLSINHIGGELPDDIGYGLAANMRRLDLSGNAFNGTIPMSLCRLRNLRYLSLDTNGIVGAIPTSLTRLCNIRYLLLDIDGLVGAVPTSLSRFTNLLLDKVRSM